jgi:hypothetical protein
MAVYNSRGYPAVPCAIAMDGGKQLEDTETTSRGGETP